MKIRIGHISILERLKDQQDPCNDISYETLEFLQNEELIKFIYADDGSGLVWRIITEKWEQLFIKQSETMKEITNSIISLTKSHRDPVIHPIQRKQQSWQDNIWVYILVSFFILFIGIIVEHSLFP